METKIRAVTANAPGQRPPADVFSANCPSRSVVDILSDKWAMLLLWSLARGPLRFGELRRRLGGVTQKMLTQTLRTLERNGLASRTVYATTPPSVEYALTPLGMSVSVVAEQMCVWAQAHFDDVLAARQDYDAALVNPQGVSTTSSSRKSSDQDHL